MKLRDQFRFVRQNMKKNRSRLFMTILATAMSVAFLIVLASVGFGLHKSVVKEITERRIVTEIEVHGKENQKTGEFSVIKDEDITYFESLKDVKAVTRKKFIQQDGLYEIEGYAVHSQPVVTHMPSEVKAGLELSKGRMPKEDDEIIVGYHFAEQLALTSADSEDLYDEKGQIKEQYRYKKSLLGKTVTFTVTRLNEGKEEKKPIQLKVVGIRKKPGKEWVYDNNVFVSEGILKQVESFTGTPKGMMEESNNSKKDLPDLESDRYDEVKIYATNIEAVKGIAEKLDKKHYVNYSVVNELKDVNMIFMIVKAGLIFIGTIAILIASIGIYNTMTMAVTERAPDIGIMKAIGANPKTIKNIFLLESSYIGMIGATIGTIVAYGISFIVNFAIPLIIKQAFGEDPPEGLIFSHIPLTLPIISFVICYFITILSGLKPANKATKVDVLQAMRREI